MQRYRLHGSALLGAEIFHAQKGSSSFRVERNRHNSWQWGPVGRLRMAK